MNKILVATAGTGLILAILPAANGLLNKQDNNLGETSTTTGLIDNKTNQIYTNSNYLKEKGYADCKEECTNIESGYEWAKTNKICEPQYDKGPSSSYNLGVKAWAWDQCAYSDDSEPI